MTTLTTRDRREALAFSRDVNTAAAARDYPAARERAAALGLDLRQHEVWHYSLRHPIAGWLLTVHAHNRRLIVERNREPRPPWLDLANGWGLRDVVEAAGKALTREHAR